MFKLNIKDLIIDERVADKVEERKGDVSKYLNDERLNRVLDGTAKGDALPPINVIASGNRWKVMDGRHRIAACILLGQDTINSKIIV